MISNFSYKESQYICLIVEACKILSLTGCKEDCCADVDLLHDVLAVGLVHLHQAPPGPHHRVARDPDPGDGGEGQRLGAA